MHMLQGRGVNDDVRFSAPNRGFEAPRIANVTQDLRRWQRGMSAPDSLDDFQKSMIELIEQGEMRATESGEAHAQS